MKRKFFAAFAALAMTSPMMAEVTSPSFPGGEDAMKEFIAAKMTYPVTARENGIEGVVNVGFVVKTDGSIGSIKIIRMVDPDLEQESIRIIKLMPAWLPATDNGKPVDASTQVEIPFILPES